MYKIIFNFCHNINPQRLNFLFEDLHKIEVIENGVPFFYTYFFHKVFPLFHNTVGSKQKNSAINERPFLKFLFTQNEPFELCSKKFKKTLILAFQVILQPLVHNFVIALFSYFQSTMPIKYFFTPFIVLFHKLQNVLAAASNVKLLEKF